MFRTKSAPLVFLPACFDRLAGEAGALIGRSVEFEAKDSWASISTGANNKMMPKINRSASASQ